MRQVVVLTVDRRGTDERFAVAEPFPVPEITAASELNQVKALGVAFMFRGMVKHCRHPDVDSFIVEYTEVVDVSMVVIRIGFDWLIK